MRYIRTLKKRTAYRKRHLALPSVDRMDIKQIERCFNYFLLVKATIDSPLPDEIDEMYHDLVELYTTMKVVDVPEPVVIKRRPVALTSMKILATTGIAFSNQLRHDNLVI